MVWIEEVYLKIYCPRFNFENFLKLLNTGTIPGKKNENNKKKYSTFTAHKIKFSIKDCFSKCEQIKTQIWSI